MNSPQITRRTEIPGPKSRALRERETALIAPGLQRFAQMAGIVTDRGRGSLLTDVDGNTYIDWIGGIGVNGLGHSHPKYVRALQEQVERASVGSFTSRPRVELLERIREHRPAPGIDRVQLYSSGAEAVESALRLARCYTGKHEFVSFYGGFHGKTLGALSLMGSEFKVGFGPLPGGSQVVPYPDPDRPPLSVGSAAAENDSSDSLVEACLQAARRAIRMNTSGAIAAIIVEPMQGSAGNVIPPAKFLPAVRALADELGALLICDEMITGFGRTGRYWGVDHSGVKPDIVTIGKQMGGGFPISGIITSERVASAPPWSNPSGSSSSYGGNPLACAAAAAALRIIDDEGLVENSRRMGEYFLSQLAPFADRYPFVGCVRGSGLFLGIDLVRDKKTRAPLSKEVTHRLFLELVQKGLLTMAYDSRFRIQPAMTIDQATIDESVAILGEVFDEVSERWDWKR